MKIKLDTLEAGINAITGIIVSWVLTIFLMGFTPTKSAGITAVFFITSFLRTWIIRIIFRKIEQNQNEN